ncbi:hypothetical protein [Rhizobacter sp. OV335]|jgi:hypothetical protein|nr:hypothetical protein [Rhizobacter sp. OV335]SHM44234.1 hypothetical protein SAMN02787076_01347 [Rhizobacter sp. OV335]
MDQQAESWPVRTMLLLNFKSREPELAKAAAASTFLEGALELLMALFS